MSQLSRDELVGTESFHLPETGGTVKIRPLSPNTLRGLTALARKRTRKNDDATKQLMMELIIKQAIVEPELTTYEVIQFIKRSPNDAARLVVYLTEKLR